MSNLNPSFILLEIAAWLHLMQVPGTLYVGRRIVGITAELPRLSALTAAIFMVMGTAVVILLVGLGILVGTHPREVLATSLGLALCGFLGTFFLVRLGIQFWYYFGLPWPRTLPARVAHGVMVGIFAAQSSAYLSVFFLGLSS